MTPTERKKANSTFQPNPGWGDLCYRCSLRKDNSQDQFPCSAVVWKMPNGPAETIIPLLVRYVGNSETCNNFQQNSDPVFQPILAQPQS